MTPKRDERLRLEGVDSCIGAHEPRLWRLARGPPTREVDHGRRDVDARARRRRAEPARQRDGRRAGAAADVEHVRRGQRRRGVGEQLLDRPEEIVEHRLRRDPRVSRASVPQRRLLLAELPCIVVHTEMVLRRATHASDPRPLDG
jgi:hypothetical protein